MLKYEISKKSILIATIMFLFPPFTNINVRYSMFHMT